MFPECFLLVTFVVVVVVVVCNGVFLSLQRLMFQW